MSKASLLGFVVALAVVAKASSSFGAMLHLTSEKGDLNPEIRETPTEELNQLFPTVLTQAKDTGDKDVFEQPIYEISVTVQNNSGRSADIINAYIEISDKLGNKLASLKWPKSRGIKAGETKTAVIRHSTIVYEIGRIVEMSSNLINVEFNIYKIAYTDGEIVDIKQCKMCNF